MEVEKSVSLPNVRVIVVSSGSGVVRTRLGSPEDTYDSGLNNPDILTPEQQVARHAAISRLASAHIIRSNIGVN